MNKIQSTKILFYTKNWQMSYFLFNVFAFLISRIQMTFVFFKNKKSVSNTIIHWSLALFSIFHFCLRNLNAMKHWKESEKLFSNRLKYLIVQVNRSYICLKLTLKLHKMIISYILFRIFWTKFGASCKDLINHVNIAWSM